MQNSIEKLSLNNSKSGTAIHWFRKGLRLHDNPSLRAALESSNQTVPLFIIDPHFQNPDYVGVNRMNFLMETLKDLDSSLQKKGLRMIVAKGKPEEVFPKLIKALNNVNLVTFEQE